MRLDFPSYPIRAVHLAAVWAYGVSQPVFSLVEGNPELLFLRDVTRREAIVLAALLAVLPPLVAVTYAWLASWFSRWAGDMLYMSLLALFLVPGALQLAKLVDLDEVPSVAMVAILCLGAVTSYTRWRGARLLVGYLIVLPIVGFVWFVATLPPLSDRAPAAKVDIPAPSPVVLVVLDELPLSSLMTRSGRIDEVRYPSFAQLARDGTWYLNATTVAESTAMAVPAILSGQIPQPESLPIASDYPENLFTLLGNDYDLHVHEATTRLCSQESCKSHRSSFHDRVSGMASDVARSYLERVLPSSLGERIPSTNLDRVVARLSTYTVNQFTLMLKELVAPRAGELYFSHLMLPHAPWRFVPSGRQYSFAGIDGWNSNETWDKNPWLVKQAFQRHLLQAQYTDSLFARLLIQLVDRGLYDEALLVVVADHGVSFLAGDSRRPITETNAADIANIPLFVKYPHQERGRTDRRAARTVDILPTIADVLGVQIPWHVDGRSLLQPSSHKIEVAVRRQDGTFFRASPAEVEVGRRATLRQKAQAFGEGGASLYGIGRNRALLGSATLGSPLRSPTIRARIENAAELSNVVKDSPFVPTRISGVIENGEIASGTEIAVAVNGRVRALTRCFADGAGQRFRALIPESALMDGFNRVDVFAVENKGLAPKLVWLGSNTNGG